MEDPQPFAGFYIEATNVAFHILLAARRATGPVRRTDNHGVAGHNRSRVKADFAGHEIDFLIVILLQVDGAVFAEAANRGARFRIEGDEAIPGSDVEDSFFTSIAPIRKSPAG